MELFFIDPPKIRVGFVVSSADIEKETKSAYILKNGKRKPKGDGTLYGESRIEVLKLLKKELDDNAILFLEMANSVQRLIEAG